MLTIEEVVETIEEWRGHEIHIEEITAGLTNSNYKVTVGEKSFVVRIPGQGSDIFINRDIELHNTLSASKVGVGAHVHHYFKTDYVVIAEFLQGSTMSIEAFKDRNAIIRAVDAIKKINMEGEFISEFIMFNKFEEYMSIVKNHNIEVHLNLLYVIYPILL